MCTEHEDLHTCMIIPWWIVHRRGNFSDKIYRENQNTSYIQYFSFSKTGAVYKIMWKNVVEPDRPEMSV